MQRRLADAEQVGALAAPAHHHGPGSLLEQPLHASQRHRLELVRRDHVGPPDDVGGQVPGRGGIEDEEAAVLAGMPGCGANRLVRHLQPGHHDRPPGRELCQGPVDAVGGQLGVGAGGDGDHVLAGVVHHDLGHARRFRADADGGGVDAERAQVLQRLPSEIVAAHHAHQGGPGAQAGRPGGLVRPLPAERPGEPAAGHRLAGPGDPFHLDHQVHVDGAHHHHPAHPRQPPRRPGSFGPLGA